MRRWPAGCGSSDLPILALSDGYCTPQCRFALLVRVYLHNGDGRAAVIHESSDLASGELG